MMWGPGPWGATPMWGFWWIFPVIGLLVGVTFLVMMVRVLTTGRGVMCMGGHHASSSDETVQMRRELDALREEVKQLKAAR